MVSRTELVEHLYDQDFDRDSNTIEVFIGRLRKKIDAGMIQTVRGLGYSLEDPRVGGRRPRLESPIRPPDRGGGGMDHAGAGGRRSLCCRQRLSRFGGIPASTPACRQDMDGLIAAAEPDPRRRRDAAGPLP